MKFLHLLFALFLPLAGVWADGLSKLKIGSHELIVELAVSDHEQETGLMNRTSLGSDQGMLFIFDQPREASFWMHNTSIPLDLAYLDEQGEILEILPLIPFEEKPVKSKSARVAYALEVNRDWFSSRGLKAGTKVQGLPAKP
ncbi:MAG: DUF192 domain-containing protein [Verrucomicrobia bacterium]|nr:DUF192 domain-containing protein [Verrucomicrobiota bacterium]